MAQVVEHVVQISRQGVQQLKQHALRSDSRQFDDWGGAISNARNMVQNTTQTHASAYRAEIDRHRLALEAPQPAPPRWDGSERVAVVLVSGNESRQWSVRERSRVEGDGMRAAYCKNIRE